MKDKVFDITIEDLPEGVPALKWKRGLYYRPNNNGYANNLIDAGFYTREDVIKDCFDENGKNGYCGVFAMPLWMAIKQGYYSKEKIDRYKERLAILEQYVQDDKVETVIF